MLWLGRPKWVDYGSELGLTKKKKRNIGIVSRGEERQVVERDAYRGL